MSAISHATTPPTDPELKSGARMTQHEFHRVYSKMPEHFKAELIGGIVYVASPLKLRHGTDHVDLIGLFWMYVGHTPGVQCSDNTTVILSAEGEPQPDVFLRILPEYGGQSRTTQDDYVKGPPELIAEVSISSGSYDLHTKREEYARNGVLEYLVLNIPDHRLHWFDLGAGKELRPDADSVYHIRTFPGLWIHGDALLSHNYQLLTTTLMSGIATGEHAEFVERLAKARHT